MVAGKQLIRASTECAGARARHVPYERETMFPKNRHKPPLFDSRLVRHDDALLIFETFAYLTRRHGQPGRPPVPSPLHKTRGLDDLRFDANGQRTLFDFAQDGFASVLQTMRLDPAGRALHAADHDQPGFLTYDPKRIEDDGYLVARLIIGVAAQELALFRPAFEPSTYQRAIVLLAGAAFFRTGLVLPRLLPAVVTELSQFGVPARFVENTLLFSASLGLRVARQTPEQIVATYGPVLSRTARKKIRPACRQIDGLEPELKLLRVLGQPKPQRQTLRGPRGDIRAVTPGASPQPQRTSWI